MPGRISTLLLMCLLLSAAPAIGQSLDGKPYTPGVDPDIDMFLGNWKESMPQKTHGSLIERDILTKGDPLNPPRKGAVLIYINRFTHATLGPREATTPTVLDGEQEVIFIDGGRGTISAGRDKADLYPGIAVLIPAKLEFTMTNTGDEPMTMYLINEPIPAGFRPNERIIVRDENTTPVSSTTGHWCHIVKGLFSTNDGLGTLESVITVSFDPMTFGHPHSHVEGCEEVWTAVTGTSVAFLGKQIRWQHPGMGYMIPPDGNTPHSNINVSDKQTKMLYFARYRDHEVRK